jgi:hypothetical protein
MFQEEYKVMQQWINIQIKSAKNQKSAQEDNLPKFNQ